MTTGLADAQTQAVAGKLNRERVWVPQGEAKPIAIRCWPQGTTSDIPQIVDAASEDIVVTGCRIQRAMPPPPPPPALPNAAAATSMAQEERLGDVRLYRVPIAVTVAAKSQKQVALMRQPSVKVDTVYRLRPEPGEFDDRRSSACWSLGTTRATALACRCRPAASRCSATCGPPAADRRRHDRRSYARREGRDPRRRRERHPRPADGA